MADRRSELRGKVKWFNPEKGFGFVSPADGSPDVFLHVSALKQAGLQDAPEGSTILCEVGPGRKGVQVLRVITLDTTTAVATAATPPDGTAPVRSVSRRPAPPVARGRSRSDASQPGCEPPGSLAFVAISLPGYLRSDDIRRPQLSRHALGMLRHRHHGRHLGGPRRTSCSASPPIPSTRCRSIRRSCSSASIAAPTA